MTTEQQKTLHSLFVEPTLAVMMMRLGFDEPCFAVWGKFSKTIEFPTSNGAFTTNNSGIRLPTWGQANKWLAKKYGTSVSTRQLKRSVRTNLKRAYGAYEKSTNKTER